LSALIERAVAEDNQHQVDDSAKEPKE
jgi:hypothetical protein